MTPRWAGPWRLHGNVWLRPCWVFDQFEFVRSGKLRKLTLFGPTVSR